MNFLATSTDNIILLGSPKVGKTTYLITLLHYFDPTEAKTEQLAIFVDPLEDKTEDLREEAKLFLKTRDVTQATPKIENYQFSLSIPGKLLGQFQEKKIIIKISDFAGEIFKKLDSESIHPQDREYIQECLNSSKWLLFLNDWEPSADQISKLRLENLLKLVSDERKTSLRVAVVMSKCERGELWSGRKNPEEDIFSVHLPSTYKMLKHYFRDRPKAIKFFACSSFGVLGEKNPLPNRVPPSDANENVHRSAVIRNIDKWKPYGLITPIVWLDTNKTWKWNYL